MPHQLVCSVSAIQDLGTRTSRTPSIAFDSSTSMGGAVNGFCGGVAQIRGNQHDNGGCRLLQ